MAENRYAITIAMGIIMAVIATIAVLLRFEARRMRKSGIKTDDYAIVGALIFLIGSCVCNLIGAFGGRMGTHESITSTASKHKQFEQLLLRSKVIWALQLLTTLGPGLTRTSIVFFYRRIFIGKSTQIIAWIFIGLNISWTIGFTFANLLGCIPIWGNWLHDPNGKCVNFFQLYKAHVISDVLLDALVLMIPWYPLWHLKMPTRQKVLVSGIFLLGGFVVLSGVFRVISMFDAIKPNPDRTWARAPAFYWATIETGTGIVSACLPTMRPLFNRPGPQSIIRSVQKRVAGSFSRTKLVSDDYKLEQRSGGSAASDGEKAHVYDGHATSAYQQSTHVESNELEQSKSHLPGIRVESSVSHNSERNHGL